MRRIAILPLAGNTTFRERVQSKLLRIGRLRGLWALADQASSSLGNFATNVILGRALARESYGSFGLILEVIFFFNAIQSALITYPLSVHGASADRKQLSKYATASLLLTLMMAAPVVLLALVAGIVSGHVLIAACAALALVSWQLQETLRRAMLAHLRHAEAVWGDAVSYIGQAVCIYLLATSSRLSLESIFGMIALTSSAAAMVQVVQVGLVRVPWIELINYGREFLAYGRFIAASNLTVICTSLGLPWVLTWFHGRQAVAEQFALLTLLKLTNPMISGIVSLLVPAAAKVNDLDGESAALRVAAKYSWLGAGVLVPYYALLIAFPAPIIAAFYGRSTSYTMDANVLRMYVAWSALTYAVATTGAYFNAIHQSRLSMIAQVVNALVSVAFGLPLAFIGGLPAAAAGMVLAVAAQLATLLHFLGRQSRRRAATTGIPVLPTHIIVQRRIDELVAARVTVPMGFRGARRQPANDSPSETAVAA